MSPWTDTVRAMTVFAVTIGQGPTWDRGRARREQDRWTEHAAFMDALVDEGFIVLGGPIGDCEKVLLVVEAEFAGDVEARLRPDPWLIERTVEIDAIQPWTIWLDGRPLAANRAGAP